MKQIIITFSIFLLFASFNTNQIFASESNIINKQAPAFSLLDLNGNKVSLSDFKGKVVILDFWATWCPPCVKEIPHFIELYKEYKDQGLAIVGISVDRQGIGVVKAFNQKFKINYPIVMTDSQVVTAYGDITGIPTTFVIDPSGKIQRMYVGYRDKSVFEADIKELLPEAKSGGTKKRGTETKPNKYVTKLNNIGIAERPESDNAAPYYQKAIELFVKQPEGLVVLTKNWPKDQAVQQQAMLKKWVKDNSRALEQMQLAGQKPYYWLKHTEEKIQTTELPNLKTMRQLVWALQNRAMLSAEEGNITSALNDIETLYTIGAQMSVGPKTLILKLTGIAVKSLPIRVVFKMLDRKMLDNNSMKTLEDRFKQLVADYREPFDIRGEKIFLQEIIETDPQFRGFKPYLKSTLEYYDTIAAKTPIQLHNETQSITEKNPLIEKMGGIPRLIELENHTRTEEQALITTLAILRYNSDKNVYPVTLSQLIMAGYLKELPKDPYSDKPFVYKRTQEGFTLYSLGGDFDDDGGRRNKSVYSEEGGDHVFWPVEKRP